MKSNLRRYEETNWTCKYEENIVTPFFTLVNGSNVNLSEQSYLIKVFDKKGAVLHESQHGLPSVTPFSSKILFAEDLVDFKSIPEIVNSEPFYISISLSASECFPRMVCGNYHKDIDFYEVTHSFESQEDNPSYLPEYTGNGVDIEADHAATSINPLATNNELNLQVTYFPTNCDSSFKAMWRSGTFGEQLMNRSCEFEYNCNSEEKALLNISIENKNSVHFIDVTSGKVPTA